MAFRAVNKAQAEAPKEEAPAPVQPEVRVITFERMIAELLESCLEEIRALSMRVEEGFKKAGV